LHSYKRKHFTSAKDILNIAGFMQQKDVKNDVFSSQLRGLRLPLYPKGDKKKKNVAYLIAGIKKRNTKHLVTVRQKQTLAEK
jgi:ATP-dependent RNA circularization protein (DNA/RNA ligase family)